MRLRVLFVTGLFCISSFSSVWAVEEIQKSETDLFPQKGDALSSVFTAQPSPENAFSLYLEKNRLNITNTNLRLFTLDTRRFLDGITFTPTQMDNEYHAHVGKKYEVHYDGDFAVLLFSNENRQLSPYFFKKESDGWQMDLATAAKAIRFNQKNEWFLVDKNHPYMFAFRRNREKNPSKEAI